MADTSAAGSGSGSGSAVVPPVCLHSQPIEIMDPAMGARLLRFSGSWLVMLAPGCGFDRQRLRQNLLGCTSSNNCGATLDASRLSALNQQFAQAPVASVQLRGRPVDVMRVPGGTAFRFNSAEEAAAGLDGLGPMPLPNPGPPRPPGPTGGGAGGGAPAAGDDLPCCPGCGRCLPNDCPDPPPVVPRFHADGCDTRVCSESIPPGVVCECFEQHCRRD